MSVDEQRVQRRQAERLVAQRRYEEAAEIYRSLLARDDTHAKAWYGIGYCYYKLGHLDQSRLSMREARRHGYMPADAMLERIRSRVSRDEPLPPNTPEPITSVTPQPLPSSNARPAVKPVRTHSDGADRHVVLTQALRRLSAHKKQLENELDALVLDAGAQAVADAALVDWPPVAAVRQASSSEEHAETGRIKAEKRERAARERYHAARVSHQERVERLRAAYEPIEAELKTLRDRIKAVEQEIIAAKAGIKAALHAGTSVSTRTDSPMVRFREAKEGAEKSRAVLMARLEELRAAAHLETDKLRNEEAQWQIDRDRMIREIDAMHASSQQAAALARQAHETHQARILDLGRALLNGQQKRPALAESASKAARLQRAISAADADIAEKQRILRREDLAERK